MKLALLALPFIAAVSLALGIGCEADRDGVEVSLELDRATYTPGQPVHMTLTVTNKSDATITIFFGDAKRYEFEVWELFDGLICFGSCDCLPCWTSSGPPTAEVDEAELEALRPGETLTYKKSMIMPLDRIFGCCYRAIGSFVGCRDELLTDCGFTDVAPFQIAR